MLTPAGIAHPGAAAVVSSDHRSVLLRTRGPLVALLLAFMMVIVAAPDIWAQSELAGVSGRITNARGGILIGADVEIVNVDTNASTTTKTNDSGFYVFPSLRPGRYVMHVRADLFKSVSVTGVLLNVQDNLSRNFQLEVGSISETVSVRAETIRAKTLDPAVSTVVNRRFVENMPLNGRSFQSLLTITPGVVMTVASPGDQGQFSVNGQRTNTNYFTVDGVSANFGAGTGSSMGTGMGGTTAAWSITGGTSGLVSVDAMQEFRIQTSNYAPEFGRTPGGQISIVTRSGANALRGGAFEYFRTDALDARNYFNPPPQPKPELSQHDFGGTAGGPVLKNRVFFFFSYEALRLKQPYVATGHYLTPAARAQVAPVWKPYVDSTPIPTGAVSPNGLTAAHQLAGSLPVTQDAISLRVDHRVNNRISMFARYNHAPSTSTIGYDTSKVDVTSNVDTFTAGGTFQLAANKVNDLRVNWSGNAAGRRQYAVALDGAVVPRESQVLPAGFSFDNTQLWSTGIVLPGDSSAVPFTARMGAFSANIQRQLNVVDTFTWTRGRHTAKFGFDWRRLTPKPAFTPQSIGLSTVSWNDLKEGTIGQAFITGGGANTLCVDNYSLFAQDTWSIRNNLTLTYGLRWDVNPAPASQTSVPLYAVLGVFDTSVPWSVTPAAGGLWKTDYRNVAPRVGAAYQVTPTIMLRAGAGMFYDIGAPSALASQAATNFPMYRSAYRMINEVYRLTDPTPFMPPPVSLTPGVSNFVAAFDPDLRTPLTYQWNVGLERQIGRSDTLSVTYIGSRGDSMLRLDSMTNPRLNGAYWQVTAIRNADRSRYNALQMSYQRRMWRGLQAQASYVLSRSRDTSSNDLSTNNGLQALKLSDIKVDYNWGNSSFDVTHVFSGAFSYEMPGPSEPGVARVLLGDWAIDGLLTLRSGLPVDIVTLSVVSYNGVRQRLRPDIVPGQPQWIDDATVPGGRRLNPNAWVAAPNGQPGNLPRNSVRNFGIRNFDFAVRRRLRISERYTLDLRAEAFNLFNTANLSLDPFVTYLGDAPYWFGVAQMTANQYLAGSFFNNEGGGISTQYGVGGARSMQLTLKFGF